ncbi:TetR/AcrR family transcriptional regulator [Burkholderia sp. MSMB1498]|uniref:TetR/AcrR family transcriptional regulator n=1 Tax=Burkholderia sp. MSMB1498 TaxID=1637842 RepID=UPI000758CAD9|nr:TetR/AcrR family transcriptional regulator [Burkholderia sp. MSMB1498]KVK83452.1 TetR family transcriptional regulator [Burkholderia sp. MSMB1498]
MRYTAKHKEASRARLIEAGAALAKQSGFANTGMDALTAAAGVTTGAFYSQFRSKPEFLHAIVEHEMSKVLATVENRSKHDLVAALRGYLSTAHADHPELGCPVPALGAEIARADVATRKMFEDLIKRFQTSIANVLHDDEAAWTLGCAAIGAVLVARAMATPERRDEVLRSVLAYTMRSFGGGAPKK